MTNKRAKKQCEDCGLRPINYDTQGRDSWACDECFEYASWENTHNDNDHVSYLSGEYVPETTERATDLMDQIKNCPVCNPELDMRKTVTPKTAAAKKVKTSKNRSHKNCGHPLTKVERAKCRAGKTIDKSEKNLAAARKTLDEIKIDTLPREMTAAEIVDLELSDTCPKCGAEGDESCKTTSGGRVRSNGGRHLQRDA